MIYYNDGKPVRVGDIVFTDYHTHDIGLVYEVLEKDSKEAIVLDRSKGGASIVVYRKGNRVSRYFEGAYNDNKISEDVVLITRSDVNEKINNVMKLFYKILTETDSKELKQKVRLVIKRKIKDDNDTSLLSLAAEQGHYDCIKCIIDFDEDVNGHDIGGMTALHYASVKENNERIIKILANHGADINAKCIFGNTALMEASKNGNLSNVMELLKYSCDVNAQNKKGETALALASHYGYSDIVKELILHGAK